MQRMAEHLALFFVMAVALVGEASASDLSCPQTYRQRCDVSALTGGSCTEPARQHQRGSQMICEYAMLHESYERIYADQQRRRYAGTLSQRDLDAWRRKRDACTTVRCLDQLFADWGRAPRATGLRDASNRAPATLADSRSARRTPLAAAEPRHKDEADLASPPANDPAPPQPIFEPVPVSLRDSLPPLPPGSSRMATARSSAVHVPPSFGWMASLVWGAILLAAGGGFYWLVVRKQATRYLDAAFTSANAGMAWLKTLPPLAFVLGGLAVLNGVLLVVLLGGWPMHIPGVN